MKSTWKVILIVWLVIAVSGCSLGTGKPPQVQNEAPTFAALADVTVMPKSNRPNFLFVLVDDLDAKLGSMQYLPHIQELMTAQGMTIDNFLISTPVCCPSRSSILRGQYAQNHQVYTNAAPLGGFDKFYALHNETSTLATWLQAAGYRTALFGKYLNGYPLANDRTYIPPGWNEWVSPARGTPYKEFNYYLNENGKLTGYGLGASDYMTDVLSQKVDDYLRGPVLDSKPFFIYLAPYAPHEPAAHAPRHANLFSHLRAPRAPSFNEPDVSNKPGGIRGNPLLDAGQIAKMDELYRQRVRSMQAVDEMVARLINTLKETGKLDNTYIIFTSDNGYHLGQHRLYSGKGTPYEEDIVVPFIIRGPGIPAGLVVKDSIAGNTDIAPTIAELAGVDPPAFVDGRSLVPLWSANSPPSDWRQGYLIEYYGSETATGYESHLISSGVVDQLREPPDPAQLTGSAPLAKFFAVRTPQYIYVEYPSGERELYDLKQDPYELNNIASTADRNLLGQFSAWLKELVECSGASCRAAENIGLH
ncbi:MAG: sulfatase [Chloroflexi bacterium]|nr:sulfatase [Chloroflexota bacterium]